MLATIWGIKMRLVETKMIHSVLYIYSIHVSIFSMCWLQVYFSTGLSKAFFCYLWLGNVLRGYVPIFQKWAIGSLETNFSEIWTRCYESSSILKTYSSYRINFGTECYLKHISKPKFRIALSKLRASSHDLEVERGRYVRSKLDINERLCISCHVIVDEEYFVTDSVNNREMRKPFFEKHIIGTNIGSAVRFFMGSLRTVWITSSG